MLDNIKQVDKDMMHALCDTISKSVTDIHAVREAVIKGYSSDTILCEINNTLTNIQKGMSDHVARFYTDGGNQSRHDRASGDSGTQSIFESSLHDAVASIAEAACGSEGGVSEADAGQQTGFEGEQEC